MISRSRRMGNIVKPHTVAVAKEIDGIEMGVLDDGTPFLTARSLAKLCGVAPSAVINQGANWLSGKRDGRLAQMFIESGIAGDSLFIPTRVGRKLSHAYPEQVCMIFLEYYAYEVPKPGEQAARAHRTLARAGFRAFVYTTINYDPANVVPLAWRQFHDRMLLVGCPVGYFNVFKESAEFVLFAIRGGLPADEHTIPDISIGRIWSNYWKENGLERQHGQRVRQEHNYPEYFAQAAANPQEIWAYPVGALGEFRSWLHNHYVPDRFPKYLEKKVAEKLLPASTAELLIAQTVAPPALGPAGAKPRQARTPTPPA